MRAGGDPLSRPHGPALPFSGARLFVLGQPGEGFRGRIFWENKTIREALDAVE